MQEQDRNPQTDFSELTGDVFHAGELLQWAISMFQKLSTHAVFVDV